MPDPQGTISSLPAPTFGGPKKADKVQFKPQGQKDVGVVEAFLSGTPNDENAAYYGKTYNPNYEPTWGESIASAVSSPIRHAGEALGNLVNPSQLEARAIFDKIRSDNPSNTEYIDNLETATLGKKNTVGQNLVKLAAGVGESALTIAMLPMNSAGKIALATAEKAIGLGAREGASALTKFAIEAGKGAAYGTLYGGLYGLHEYDADWKKAMQSAAWGAGIGVGGVGFLHTLAFASRATGRALSPVLEGVISGGKALKEYAIDNLPPKLTGAILGTASGIESIARKAGVNGKKLIQSLKDFSEETLSGEKGLGVFQRSMMEVGAQDVPSKVIFRDIAKTLKKQGLSFAQVGGNEELMTEGMKVMEGIGKYADDAVREEAIKASPYLQRFQQVYQSSAATAESLGLLGEKGVESLGPKYVKHALIDIKMPKTLSTALSELPEGASVAQKIETYKKYSDPQLTRTIDYQVEKGTFDSPLRGFEEAYDYAGLRDGSGPFGKDNKFLQGTVTRGEFGSLEDAAKAFAQDLNAEGKSITSRSSSLDYERKVKVPFYDTNIARVTSQYGEETIKRFAAAERFGKNDAKLKEILTKIRKEPKLGDKARSLADDMEQFLRVAFGTTKSHSLEPLSRAMRMLETPHLVFSAIQNLSQSANTLLASDLGSFIRGTSNAFKNENLIKQMEAGGFVQSFLKQAYQYNAGASKAASKMLSITGFAGSEIINRAIAGNVANEWLTMNFNKLVKEYGADGVMAVNSKPPSFYALKELGVDVEAALARGELTNAERALASFKFTEKTQFTGNPLDLPYFASHPLGKVALQFKTFAYQQSRFALNQIAGDIAQKNFTRLGRDLLLLGTVYPMSGNVVRNVRSLITQEKAPNVIPTSIDEYVTSVFNSGGMGIVGDLIKAIQQDRGPEYLIGASTNDIYTWIKAGGKGVRGDIMGMLKDGAKQGLNQTGIGIPVKNVLFPSSAPGESTLEKLF